MMNPPNDPDLHAVVYEASCRIRVAVKILNDTQDPDPGAPDYGGYDVAILRDILEDVGNTLHAAADELLHAKPANG